MDKKSHALTLKSTGISKVLVTPVIITEPESYDEHFETLGIWDTGATGTVITQKVVDLLKLKPTGIVRVNTASQKNVNTYTFLVDVVLQNGFRILNINATLGILTDSIDVLIGMDIICLEDFSVTNFNGNTCMSFRIPSYHEIDYVSEG